MIEDAVDLEWLLESDDFQVAFCSNCGAKRNPGTSREYCPALEPGREGCERLELYELILEELRRAKNMITDAMAARGCE